ncbi:MAG TPA: hypothetical protein VIC62_07685 [Nakamurella sp.]
MTSVHLVGGGWDPAAAGAVYRPFLVDAAALAGRPPEIACVVLDEGDGSERFDQWSAVLRTVADCVPRPMIVPLGGRLSVPELADAHGLLVGGGLTSGYADALVPVAAELRAWLADRGRPYLGFSAGAAIAANTAVVGGWLSAGVPVCPDDAGEDLAEITVRPGLGFTTWTVDVHCAQWGTLPRLIEAVRTNLAAGNGLGIDENTVASFDGDGRCTIAGSGHVWLVHRGGSGEAQVRPFRAGSRI